MTLTLTEIILIIIAAGIGAIGIVVGVIAIKHRKPTEVEPLSKFNRDLIAEPLQSGVHVIIGPQGCGKTSFGMALACEDYRWHRDDRLAEARKEVAKMQAVDASYNSLRVPACPYRTRTRLFLPNGKPTYHIDISQFGLPEGQADVQYLPKSTFVFCDEIDSFMDSRRWQEDKQYITDGFKYVRHHDITFVGDAQCFDKIDISIRRLTTDIYYITSKKDYYNQPKWWAKLVPRARERKIIRTEWRFIHVKQQLMSNAQQLKSLGIETPVSSYFRKCKFVYEGDIYSQYNSYSGAPYWYNGIKIYEIEEHPHNNLTRAGVEQWCKSNALRFEAPIKANQSNKDAQKETNQTSDSNKDGKSTPKMPSNVDKDVKTANKKSLE
jgi:hypothetical protein